LCKIIPIKPQRTSQVNLLKFSVEALCLNIVPKSIGTFSCRSQPGRAKYQLHKNATVNEEAHLQFMVITNNKRLPVHSQKENTFPTISNTNMFCCYNYMNSFTMFYSDSLANKNTNTEINFFSAN